VASTEEQDAIPFALQLAAKICGFGNSSVTERAKTRARSSIIDTIAVTLAGVPEPCSQLLLKTGGIARAPGTALVFGTDLRTSALDATLVNGTASRALEFDDCSAIFSGHPSAPLFAVLLSLGEERKASGTQIMLAYLVGVETEIRLARVVHHDDKGWDATSTLGTIGAAAAASHLLALEPRATATALAMATSLAGGIKSNFGAMTKSLHIGHCGRNGLMAALLAEAGYDANHVAFEDHQGFFNVFNGPGLFDMDNALDNWADGVGGDADDPPTSDGLWEKFNDCARRILPREQIAPLFERLETFDTATDVSQITQLAQVSRLHDRGTPKPVSFARRGTAEAHETTWVP
jgi:2-methylcitrate dehydratase PrpD